MKKLLITLSLIVVFACLFAVSAFAATEIDGIYYNFNGTGENAYASVSNANATSCTLENVVIPESVTYNGIVYPVTTIDYHAFSGSQGNWGKNQTVKTMYIPESVTTIGAHFLRECKSVESVVIKAKNANGITLSDAEFYNCTSLKTVDLSESDIVSFRQYTFYGCSSLITVDYPKNLTNIGGHAFRLCKSFTSGDLSNTKVVSLGGGAFWDCNSLTEVKLPNTLESLGGNCFQETPLTTIIFPHSLKTLSNDAIANNRKLYLMVLPEIDVDNTGLHSGAIHDFYPKVVIYSGTEYAHLTESGKLFASYKVEPFANYDPTKTYTERTFFYGATTCDNCNGLLGEEDMIFNGYSSDLKLGKTCTHCNKENITENFGTMIKCLGYSTPQDGRNELAIGFIVNENAIKEYETRTNKTISYGVFAILKKNVTEGDIVNPDGTVMDGTIKAEVSRDYFSYEFKLAGFNTPEQKAIEIALGSYVIASDGSVDYVQSEYDTEDLLYVSYDSINAMATIAKQ